MSALASPRRWLYNNNAFVSRLQYVNPSAAISPNHVVYYTVVVIIIITLVLGIHTHMYYVIMVIVVLLLL